MKRLIAKQYQSGTGDYVKAWAKNIKTNTLVEVDLLNQYDSNRTEVGYMDSKFLVANEDLFTPEEYEQYISDSELQGISKEDAIQNLIRD